ncbi:MAG TPA: hypothetical protein VF461_17510 [Gemmatimonadaceae bacterium]
MTASTLAPPIAPPAPRPVLASLALVGAHFGAATFYLAAGALGLVWIAPELAIGAYPSPHVAGITHLFTLGWLTTMIFGALHQLLPVGLGAPMRSVRVGHLSFWSFAPGVGLFAAGVATHDTMLHHGGIALVGTGILLGAGNVAATLPRARARHVDWFAMAIALCFLVSTLGVGIVLLHNLHTGFLAEARVRVLSAHLHVAIVGWALTMIVGVSHRLLPMFLLAHGANMRWTKRALVLLTTGVIVLSAGLVANVSSIEWAGTVLLDAGVACYLWQVVSLFRARIRPNLDIGMRYVAVALSFLGISAGIGPAVLAAGASHRQLATVYLVVGLLGGIVLLVIGYFYKIAPMLAWTVRYGDKPSGGDWPSVAQTFSARVAAVQLGAMALGVTLLAAGIAAGSVHVTRCGAVLFVVGVALLLSQIARITLGDPIR